ncbi:helix-turn-helix domain containing protein [Vagococcus lutrae]|uniref:helix-turn-helix domain containing protein n=1 Tax=Vagococcus lutrae TaxID=81947 RepID=UPI00288D539B|nr:helix-turn-helix domain containing protein [Vagococcus lutrae]MDT2841186.1 helix-turn-helix domain containing protein [Vagococcus lutrae]
MIHHFLDAQSNRQYDILLILKENAKPIKLEIISEKLNVSLATIKQDLSLIETKWGHLLNLSITDSQKVEIKIKNNSLFQQIIGELITESVPLKWLTLMFFEPYKTLTEYADKLHVSRSTLYRTQITLENAFEALPIHIRQRQTRFFLEGDTEDDLRRFFAAFLLESFVFPGAKVPYPDIFPKMATVITSCILSESEIDDDQQFYFFQFLYYVSLFKEYHGFANEPKEFAQPLEEVTKASVSSIRSYFPTLKQEQFQQIHEGIYAHIHGWKDVEERDRVELTAFRFSKMLREKTSVQLNDKQQEFVVRLVKQIYLTEKISTTPSSVFFDRFYYFSKTVEKSNTSLFQILNAMYDCLSEEIGLDPQLHRHSVIYWLCIEIPSLLFYMPKLSILVVSDLGKNHGCFAARMIKNILNYDELKHLNFTIASLTDYATMNTDDFDLMIINNTQIQHPSLPVFYIDDCPQEIELYRFKKYLNRIVEQKKDVQNIC